MNFSLTYVLCSRTTPPSDLLLSTHVSRRRLCPSLYIYSRRVRDVKKSQGRLRERKYTALTFDKTLKVYKDVRCIYELNIRSILNPYDK